MFYITSLETSIIFTENVKKMLSKEKSKKRKKNFFQSFAEFDKNFSPFYKNTFLFPDIFQ